MTAPLKVIFDRCILNIDPSSLGQSKSRNKSDISKENDPDGSIIQELNQNIFQDLPISHSIQEQVDTMDKKLNNCFKKYKIRATDDH